MVKSRDDGKQGSLLLPLLHCNAVSPVLDVCGREVKNMRHREDVPPVDPPCVTLEPR